jgi:hypothetical protein
VCSQGRQTRRLPLANHGQPQLEALGRRLQRPEVRDCEPLSCVCCRRRATPYRITENITETSWVEPGVKFRSTRSQIQIDSGGGFGLNPSQTGPEFGSARGQMQSGPGPNSDRPGVKSRSTRGQIQIDPWPITRQGKSWPRNNLIELVPRAGFGFCTLF